MLRAKLVAIGRIYALRNNNTDNDDDKDNVDYFYWQKINFSRRPPM